MYGTRQTPATSNQPGSRHRSTSWTDAAGDLWLFGGFGYAMGATPQMLNDLWKYDPVTNQWVWMSGNNLVNSPGIYGSRGLASSSNVPGARYGSLGWTDGSGNLWLFGGYGIAQSGPAQFLNDLWKYDPLADLWTWVNGDSTTNMAGSSGSKGIGASSNKPGGRYGGASWKDANGNLWMFGGKGYSNSLAGDLNDLWKYDPGTNEWTWVNGDNTINNAGVYGTSGIPSGTNKPGSRYLGACWIESGNLWLFGGEGYGNNTTKGHLNDLWKYDIAANQWTWQSGDNTLNSPGLYGTKGLPATSNKPGARQGIASWTDQSGNLFLFGGYISTSRYFNDLWKFSPATNEWTWIGGENTNNNTGVYGLKGLAAASNSPGSRYVTAYWKDTTGRFWLFGGEGYGATSIGYLNDLWSICALSGSITPASAAICNGAVQALTTSGGTGYQWSLNGVPINGATSATFNAGSPGIYTVLINNGTCSAAASNTSVITVKTPAAGSIIPTNAAICTGETQALVASGGIAYQWSLNGATIIGATSATYDAASAGNYSVMIINGNCTAAASNTCVISMKSLPAGSITPAFASLCTGETQTLVTSGGTAYQWSLNGAMIAGATSASYAAASAGNFTVMINNGNCSAAASNNAVVSMNASPVISIMPISASICTGATQMLVVTGGDTYQWSLNGTAISGATAATYNAREPGIYSVMIRKGNCSAGALNTVIITSIVSSGGIRYPTVDVLKNVAQPLTARDIGMQYRWDPATGLSDPLSRTPDIKTDMATEFKIFITTASGCITTDTVLVKPALYTQVFVPSGFTPNGDNKNDLLLPMGGNASMAASFEVYNRWGQLIYKTSKSGEGWDGKLMGVPQPSGVYVWIFKGKDLTGKTLTLKGLSTLIR